MFFRDSIFSSSLSQKNTNIENASSADFGRMLPQRYLRIKVGTALNSECHWILMSAPIWRITSTNTLHFDAMRKGSPTCLLAWPLQKKKIILAICILCLQLTLTGAVHKLRLYLQNNKSLCWKLLFQSRLRDFRTLPDLIYV